MFYVLCFGVVFSRVSPPLFHVCRVFVSLGHVSSFFQIFSVVYSPPSSQRTFYYSPRLDDILTAKIQRWSLPQLSIFASACPGVGSDSGPNLNILAVGVASKVGAQFSPLTPLASRFVAYF